MHNLKYIIIHVLDNSTVATKKKKKKKDFIY